MRRRIFNRKPTLLILLLSTLFLTASPLEARKKAEILYLKHMDGEIGLTKNQTSLITKGDIVSLEIEGNKLIVGDRMFIYQPLVSPRKRAEKEGRLALVGSLIIHSIIEERVYAKIDSVRKEIHSGNGVKFELPRYVQHGRYFPFLKKIIEAKLDRPAVDRIKVGIIDVTNQDGNITRLTETIYKGMDLHFCKRRQLECVSSDKIQKFLRGYGITTSFELGAFMRKKVAEEFSLDLLITASASNEESDITMNLTAWDMKDNKRTAPYIINEPLTNFMKSSNPPYEILKHKSSAKYGHLKIIANYDKIIKGKRVDYLFMDSIQQHLYRKYKGVFSENISNDVMLDKIIVSIKNQFYRPDEKNVIFDDVLKAGKHRLLISVTPVLKGGSDLVVGDPIEKLVILDILPDEGIETEVIFTTYMDRAIIIVDSNSTQ